MSAAIAWPAAVTQAHRHDAADALRAWAMVGVVTIHAADLVLSPSQHQAVSAYFRWAVPAFITLSAYFSVASLRRAPESFRHFMGRRLRKIGLPFLAYSLIYFVLTAHVHDLTPTTALTRHFSGYGWAGQYFFIVLCQLLPVFLLLSRVAVGTVVLAIAFLLGLALLWAAPEALDAHLLLRQLSDRPFIYWLPYAVLGAFLAQHEASWQGVIGQVPAALPALAVLMVPCLIVQGPPPTGNHSPYLLPSVLLASFILVPCFLVAGNRRWPSFVGHAGRHSLAVFCLNPLFIELLRRSGWLHPPAPGASAWANTCAAVVLVFAIMAACLLSAEALKRVGLKSLVL